MSSTYAFARRFDLGQTPRQAGIGGMWTESSEVLRRAEIYESALMAFDAELEKNPKIKPGVEKDPKLSAEYEKLAIAEGNLWLDWFGNKDETPPGEILGYRNELKQSALFLIGAEELAVVKSYEARLDVLREKYKALGFVETIKPTPPPAEVDSYDIFSKYLKIAGVVVVVGAIGYVLLITQPMWMPTIAGAFSTRRTAAA